MFTGEQFEDHETALNFAPASRGEDSGASLEVNVDLDHIDEFLPAALSLRGPISRKSAPGLSGVPRSAACHFPETANGRKSGMVAP